MLNGVYDRSMIPAIYRGIFGDPGDMTPAQMTAKLNTKIDPFLAFFRVANGWKFSMDWDAIEAECRWVDNGYEYVENHRLYRDNGWCQTIHNEHGELIWLQERT